MARARNIKPGFFKNEHLGTADPFVSLLFAGLWTLADKSGILEDRPLRIKAEIFPYRENLDINGYLTVLVRLNFIMRYEVNGIRLIKVLNFEKHQNPHHTEKKSEYPDFKEEYILTGNEPLNNGYTPADSLIPDSLIPDSLNTEQPKKRARQKHNNDVFPEYIPEQLKNDFLSIRKAKRLPLTKTALDAIIKEAEKAGINLHEALEICCKRGWAGFDAEWIANSRDYSSGKKFDPVAFINKGRLNPGGENGEYIDGESKQVA